MGRFKNSGNRKFILAVSLLFVALIIASNSGVCWINGDPSGVGTKRSYGDFEAYASKYFADDSSWFCTHDYVALFALRYLHDYYPSVSNWLYNEYGKFFHIYLVATEYPDYPSPGSSASGAPEIHLDCGETTVGSDFGDGNHNVYIINGVPGYSPAATKVSERAIQAEVHLSRVGENSNPDPQCGAGAFYLGALTHYIADVACVFHTYSYSVSYSQAHADIEYGVGRVTLLQDYRSNGAGSFFKIDLANILGKTSIISIFPYTAATYMALVTHNNLDYTLKYGQGIGTWGAGWLSDFTVSNHDLFTIPWTSDLRQDALYKPYFDRLEVLLNWAVYFVACALLHILEDFSGTCTECGEEYRPDPWDRSGMDAFDMVAKYMMIVVAVSATTAISVALAAKGIKYVSGKIKVIKTLKGA